MNVKIDVSMKEVLNAERLHFLTIQEEIVEAVFVKIVIVSYQIEI